MVNRLAVNNRAASIVLIDQDDRYGSWVVRTPIQPCNVGARGEKLLDDAIAVGVCADGRRDTARDSPPRQQVRGVGRRSPAAFEHRVDFPLAVLGRITVQEELNIPGGMSNAKDVHD